MKNKEKFSDLETAKSEKRSQEISGKNKEIADSKAQEDEEILKIKIRREIAEEIIFKFHINDIPKFITLPPDQETIGWGDTRVRKICLRCLIIHRIDPNDDNENMALKLTSSMIWSSVVQQPKDVFCCPICDR